MQKFKMLVLTDHTRHSAENSLYAFMQVMRRHERCDFIDVATRGYAMNDLFFQDLIDENLFVHRVDESFAMHPHGASFKRAVRGVSLRNYDVVWLRMPPPLSDDFLNFLIQTYPNQFMINNPLGIKETGSKRFLLNFPELCPPMRLCTTVEDILQFKEQFPIVLKPLQDYGGKGIVKIEGEFAWDSKEKMDLIHFMERIRNRPFEYLAVRYLKNVSKGDKRIVVVDGKIMGASLRLPGKDSWLCNVAMGGTSNYTEVDADEAKIVERISPVLADLGIVMFGVDTLVGDDDRRVLSEINTTSIGGLPQIARLTGQPLVERAADLLWKHIENGTR